METKLIRIKDIDELITSLNDTSLYYTIGRGWKKRKDRGVYFSPDMLDLCGQEVEVEVLVDDSDGYDYYVNGWYWINEWVEEV